MPEQILDYQTYFAQAVGIKLGVQISKQAWPGT